MAYYMSQFSYTTEAWVALEHHPVNRREALDALAAQNNAKIVAFFYSFGEQDGILIIEAPSNIDAAAMILAAIAPGHVKSIKTTVLITPEEMLVALDKAGHEKYSAPK